MKRAGLLAVLVMLAGPMHAQVRADMEAGLAGPATWSAGRITASWFHPVSPFQVELTGTARAQYGTGLGHAAAAWGGGRLHLAGSDRGIWLGLEGGREPLGPVRRWEAAAWKHLGRFSVQVQGSQSSVSMTQSAGGDSIGGFPDTLTRVSSRRTVTTTDVGIWVRWLGERAELAVATGMRFGMRQPGRVPGVPDTPTLDRAGARSLRTSSTWWMTEGTWWFLDRIGVLGSVGQQPIDPAVATSGESFLRLGFRAAVWRRRPAVPRSPAPAHRTARFGFERRGDDLVEFTLDADGADQVELMGDFTDWSPVAMQRVEARWRLLLPVTRGLHWVNVRYNGGPWQAPPLPRVVRDEFGLESGEFTIR